MLRPIRPRALAPFIFLTFALGLASLASSPAAAEASGQHISLDRMLVLGPAEVPVPAFADDADAGFKRSQLLDAPGLDPRKLRPAEGKSQALALDASTWRSATGDLEAGGSETDDRPRLAWLATYLETPRFAKLEIELSSRHRFVAFLDGEEVARQAEPPEDDDDAGDEKRGKTPSTKASLALKPGKHLLLVKALFDPAGAPEWSVTASWNAEAPVTASLDPRRHLLVDDLFDPPAVTSIDVSPDGMHVALAFRRPAIPSDDGERWIEIRRVGDGEIFRTLRGVSDFSWADARRYGFVTTKTEGKTSRATLWRESLDGGEPFRLVDGGEDFAAYRFLPDGSGVVYAVVEKAEDEGEVAENDDVEVKRFRDPTDRWPEGRDRIHLVLARDDGTARRLTVARPLDRLLDIHPDGDRILISRTHHGVPERPYSQTELFEIDFETLTPRRLHALGWFDDAAYRPDGQKLLITGGPSLFDGLGANVPEGAVANDYDTQAYLLDLESGEVEAITRELDPTVRGARWGAGGQLFLHIEDRSWVRLARYDEDSGLFDLLPTKLDVIRRFDVADDAATFVWSGSGASMPPRVEALTMPRAVASGATRPRTLEALAEERFADIELGRVESFSFTAEGERSAGRTIEGRYYLPPDFDPQKRYPLLVYYYGGTAPTTRDFGGRFPKELWAARGYVVYVLQPSGATGFGQAFSALHVNDWSKTVADEIIEGTKKFVAEHAFVDGERIGCLGASYGGFMTMRLLTKTDLYAAAVSHAGISNIAAYWGEGNWGYLYSSVASAESFPWNARELYVDESPLFHADKITTPLLLLHGDADTNVPPGQSHQMYTALELLGRDVELIEIGGQNHRIVPYAEARIWTETILAFFDWKLRGDDGAWRHLYGEGEGKR